MRVLFASVLAAMAVILPAAALAANNPVPTVSSALPNQAVAGATVPITLNGTGFVAGTVVLVNGVAVPTTYKNSGAVLAQIPAPSGTPGNVSVQAQNPAPGGGTSPTFQLSVASLQLTATNPDGTNTGTARLGVPLQFSTTNTDTGHQAIGWGLNGASWLTASGNNAANATYNTPTTMPANPKVTVTAYLSNLPALTTSYTFTLINPVPTVTAASPTQALAGSMVQVALNGTGFVSGTTIMVNGAPVPTTYVSPTALQAQISAPAGSTGNLAVMAQNPAPGGGTSAAAFQLATASLQLTATDPDGTNTGTAQLGVPVNFTTTNTDLLHSGRGWSLQGAGKLSLIEPNDQSAIYTPPASMPANPTVTVTAFLSGLPALTTSYTFTLVDPVPTVSSATPAQLLTGGTQTLTLAGTGFEPGMTVVLNGVTSPVNFIDYNDATVQVNVPANASGSLTFRAQNPAPGGGLSHFSETVVPNAISLAGIDAASGNPTNSAALWGNVNMSATVTGSMQTAVNWSLTGPGSLSAAGVYTSPNTMPDNQAVTIQATLVSNPAITASYPLTIVNPDPSLAAASPSSVPAGATTAVALSGLGFVPSTVIEVNGTVVPSTFVDHHTITAQITTGANATGNLQVQASTAGYVGGTSDIFDLPITTPASLTAAARLLDQTTFGPTTSLIQHVQSEGITAWLAEQFNTPQTFLPIVPPTPTQNPTTACFPVHCLQSEWWQTAITANDQLRQRIAFALSQLFVVSTDTNDAWSIQQYHNMLARDAFSNWYNIMTDVTLSPAMGVYLNMLNSAKPTGTLIANENFARENMQLFNMGLDLMNQDGSWQLDGGGQPIPAYTEAQVQAFARVFTGWTYANADGSAPNQLNKTVNDYSPMVAVESQHDESAKTLLSGPPLPAGQTAEQDLAAALTNIFQHPNVPPFVSKQLIQHLVKSSPSPDYISRVAAVFTNDGANVRGNMQAVLTAIFTDPEARAGDTAPQLTDGHLREPVLWMTGVMRGLGYVNIDPNNYWGVLSDGHSMILGEAPYESASVFNFFPPSYVIPGTTTNAPEFGVENTASVVDRLTQADELVFNDLTGFNVDMSTTSPLGQVLVSQGPAALVNSLSQLFLYGTMDTNTAGAITTEISSMSHNPQEQLRVAVYLTITSSEYKVLH